MTRGRGVSVHRADCPNAQDLKQTPERIIEVAWENDLPKNTSFKVEVFLDALDRMNLLRDVAIILSEQGANVLSSSTTRIATAWWRCGFCSRCPISTISISY